MKPVKTTAFACAASLLAGTAMVPAFAQGESSMDENAPNSDSPMAESAMEMEPAGSAISGTVGVDYASHFISYGADVWGAGDDFYGTQSTNFAYIDLGVELPEGFALTFGVWSDINNNAPESLGGNIQEIDVYGGVTYTTGPATLGVVYQEWHYGGDTESILDLSAGFDDSGFWGGDFALNPSAVAHIRVNGQPGQEEGVVWVGAVEPGFALGDTPVSLSIPTSVAFVTSDYYGGDGGYAYTSVGATASVGLGFIPAAYGDWSLAVNTTYYNTDDGAIPTNPEDSFITGNVGISMAF